MKIVALHLASPVDGMRCIPAAVATITEGAQGFVVVLGSRVFAIPRELCVLECVEEPPKPEPDVDVVVLSTGHISTRTVDADRASGIRVDPNVKRRR